MLLRANPDARGPVRKAAHPHGNAHMSKKLLWERPAGLNPWILELLWTGSFSLRFDQYHSKGERDRVRRSVSPPRAF